MFAILEPYALLIDGPQTDESVDMNAVDAVPGVSGLSGSIEGTEAGGTVKLASMNATLELERVFRAPLAFAVLEAQAQWRNAGQGLEVTIVEAYFANPDADNPRAFALSACRAGICATGR